MKARKGRIGMSVLVMAVSAMALILLPSSGVRAEKKASAVQKKTQQQKLSVFEELRKRYFHLRNTDMQVTSLSEWEGLAREFQEFVRANPASADSPSALLSCAVLYEQIFRRLGGEDRLRMSMGCLDQLVKDFPLDSLADDALIRKADYLLYDFNEPDEARRVFKFAWEKYPRSDMREVARSRLRSLDSGEYKAWQKAEQAPVKAAARGLDRKVLVVLDPGHGGEDFGAKGVGGLLEKDVALAMAIELEKLLLEEEGVGVRLTRRTDIFVPLAERIQFANDYEADLFLSIHNNASPRQRLSGIETFYLDNTNDEASRLLAERENATVKVSQEAESDLQFMLSDLIQNAKLEESIVFANLMHRTMANGLRSRFDSINDLGVRKAPFYVLVGAHMPCALTELFFIDNEGDGLRLAKKDFRSEVARNLKQGIMKFLKRQRMLEKQ